MKYLNKIIEYSLYLLVFLLPLQTRWIIKSGQLNGGYWEYGTYSLYASDILLLVILLLFIVVIASDPKDVDSNQRLPRRPAKCGAPRNDSVGYVWLLIALLELVVFVSIFFAADKVLALFYYGRFLLGIGLFWLITSAYYSKVKLIWSLLAGLSLQACLGILQFLSQATFASKWLGLALHQASDLGTSVVETVGAGGVSERWLRAYGGMDHPNVLGGVMVVGVLLVVFLLVDKIEQVKITNYAFVPSSVRLSSPKSGRGELRITNLGYNIRKSILWVVLVLFFVAWFFSFSRAAGLAVLAGIAVIIALAALTKNLKWQKSLAEVILVLGILAFLLFNQYQNLVETRYSASLETRYSASLLASGRLENKSNVARLESYKNSWQLIKDNWLIGVGAGNYTLALKNKLAGNWASYDYQPVHNVFLLVWSETGIVGFLGLLGLLGYIIIFNFQFSIFKQFSIFNLSILLSLIILLSLDHWLWSLHFGALFFWLIIGLVYHQEKN